MANKCNKNNSPQISLKIMSGLHQGACTPLICDHYTIGRADSCDFILSDKGIAPRHLLLSYSDNIWHVAPADGVVFLDGHPVLESAKPVMPRSIITIDSVHMTLSADHDDWTPVEFPDIKPLAPLQTQHKAIPKQTSRLCKLAKTGAIGLALLFVYWISQNAVKFDQPDFDAQMDEVHQMLKLSSLSGGSVSKSRDGYIEVTAYAPDQTEKKAFMDKLKNMDIPSRATIYIEQDLARMAASYISMMQYPVRVKYKGQGRIHISGYARDNDEIAKVVSGIKENVPGINQTEHDIHFLGHLMKTVHSALRRAKLDQKIRTRATADGLTLVGELQSEQRNVWRQSKDTILNDLKPGCKIIDQISYASEQIIKPGKIIVPITSVSLGDIPYVTLKGGKKCFEGGPLKAGAIISRITAQRIIVKIQGREYQYTY